MRRKTTKELLADSFRELTETKPINKITISNITDNCGLTQPTFYRHFRDKYDMIAWLYVSDAKEIMGQIGTNGYTWRDTLLAEQGTFPPIGSPLSTPSSTPADGTPSWL